VLDQAVGEARPRCPLRPDTLMRWYCAGKPVVAVAACQLLDRLDLPLDLPVATVVPEFAAHGKAAVTVGDLLSHNVPYVEETAERVLLSVDHDVILAAACDASIRPPDDQSRNGRYSRATNYLVLTEIIRRLADTPPGTYLRSDVFVPLGMADTWAALGPEQLQAYGPERRAATYLAHSRGRRRRLRPIAIADRPDVVGFCAPSSTIWGPAHDLGRFYEAILAARRGLAGPLAPDVAHTVSSPRRAIRYEEAYGFPMQWGCGAQTLMWPLYGRYVSFAAFGHDGMQAALALADPDLDLVVVHLANAMNDQSSRNWRQLLDQVYRELGLGSTPHERDPDKTPVFARPDGSLVRLCGCGSCVFRVDDADDADVTDRVHN